MDNKKKITFGAYISFGKCDSVDWEFDFEVTEEEHNRLLEAAKEYFDFNEAEEVADIYAKVYDVAVTQATKDCLENDAEGIKNYLREGQTLEDWRADDTYMVVVNFPTEWQEMLEEEY